MTTKDKTSITVQATIKAPVAKVWKLWTDPVHIIHWNTASDDWHTTTAENDLHVGGKFSSRMEARDGSVGFDFWGEYTKVEPYKILESVLGDGRSLQVTFTENGYETTITEVFEAEQENSVELQQSGWQAILNNFKKYVKSKSGMETLHFEITIHANAEKVYKCMLDKEGYQEWTAAFNPTSCFNGSWEKGSKNLFLGTDANGNTGGMVSRIKENIPNKFVSIQHLGIIKGDTEITSGPEVEGWAGALENYTFTEKSGYTLLCADLDANQEFMPYFNDTWPKAFNKMKEICER